MTEIKRIDINNQKYPSSLKAINNPPQNLYYRGLFLPNEICFAIVGARKCTEKGKTAALRIAKKLSNYFTIVSGLALGIDSAAHLGTIENGKRTIAVLGSGIKQKEIYPFQNKKLANQIIEKGGCLISEFPDKKHFYPKRFLERNRIIAGLSIAILAIEAKFKSGTSSTIRKAQKQNKKVFTFNSDQFSNTIPIKSYKGILKQLKNEINFSRKSN